MKNLFKEIAKNMAMSVRPSTPPEAQLNCEAVHFAHRARLLGEHDPTVLLGWLRDEITTRGDQTRGTVGFHLAAAIEPIQRLRRDEQRTA